MNKLSKQQREEFAYGIENEGFDYYLTQYIGPELFEKYFDQLPSEIKNAWVEYNKAKQQMEKILEKYKATMDFIDGEEDE